MREHALTAPGTLVAVALSLLLGLGCEQEQTPPDVVARLGDTHLTRDDLTNMMRTAPVGQDSVEVQEQIIEQWVTNELLHQEALRRGLLDDPDVQRLLEENERTILINALVSSFYEEEIEEPSVSEIQSYYERHREQLGLRSPYVHVRFLSTVAREEAEAARQGLLEAETPEAADSLWNHLVQSYALDPEGSVELAQNYYPENQLFSGLPQLRNMVRQLQNGEVGPIVEDEAEFHIVQLVERVPAGTIPEREWVEEEIRRRLVIQARKQMVARQVQRLRTEALSQNELETP